MTKQSTCTHYVGVLPYAIHNGKTMYLIGKEHAEAGWNGSKKWSDFGGDPDGETSLKGAAREFYEETMGFFGTISELTKRLKTSPVIKTFGSCTYLLELEYDPLIPKIYERVHRYFLQCATRDRHRKGYMSIPSCPEGLFEKTDIRWISETQLRAAMKKRSKQYRPEFIQSLVHIL